MDAEIKMVASILKSCLITSKNGCSIDQINKEYKMMEGQYIPYQKLGFQTLDAFIRTVPHIRILRRGNDLWVQAIPTQECAHISRLVANQNRPKMRRRKRKNFVRPTFPRRPQPVPSYRGFRSANPVSQNNRLTSFSKPQIPMTPTTPAKVTVYPPKLVIQQNIVPSQQQKLNNSPTKPQYNATQKTVSTSQGKFQDTTPVYESPKKTTLLERLRISMNTATIPPSSMTPFMPITPITPMTPMARLSSLTRTFSNTTIRRDDGTTNLLSQDPRLQLEKIAKSLNLPAPEYRDVFVHGKNRIGGKLYGQVLVGSQKFSSYPKEATSKTEAEILAAREALIHLRKETDVKLCLYLTSDKDLVKQRVLNIIEQHNGVFTYKIPEYYEEQHHENLPEDWAKDIEKWTEIAMDEGVNGAAILRRRIEFTDTDRASSTMNEKVLLTPIGSREPAPLQLPEEHEWIASVILVNSWDEIWVRPDGESYRDAFDEMTANMIKHYGSMRYPTTDVVEIGAYYALPEDEYCNRVRVTDYDTTTCEATIFFIDSGEEDTVPVSTLLPLEEMFCSLSPQAIKVSLAGLEEFSDCPSTFEELMPEIEKLLLNDILYAVDVNREMEDDVPVAAVIFYNMNKSTSYEVNGIIKEKIIEKLVGTSPNLEGEKSVTEINISHVEHNGNVFIQVKNESLIYLVNALDKLINGGLSEEDTNKSIVETIDRTRMYIVKCAKTGNWFRARIIDVMSETLSLLKVFLIDIGRTINVSSDNILQLEILSKVLAKFPAQAIKVRLHDINSSLFDEETVARLMKLAPPSQTLLLKVVTPAQRDSAPTVNLFKRHETDNVLIHINVALALENELSKNNDDGNNNVCKLRKRIDRVNSRPSGEQDDVGKTLKPPRIPEIGASFHVYVTMAANPSNFTVQPYKNRVALAAMMSELQQVCLSYTGPCLSLASIQEGKFYAAQDLKGVWHRALISNIINDYMVTVHFCDYGDVTVITLNKLQPLAKQFLYLPYQAIKARLFGILPNNIEWSPEDCARFQELVLGRDFDSIITESTPKKQSPGKTVRALKLIDISSHEHIYIDRLLVDEGRAKRTD